MYQCFSLRAVKPKLEIGIAKVRYEHSHDKTLNLGFRQGPTQIGCTVSEAG